MNVNIVGMAGVGIHSPEYRRNEMAHGIWPIGVRNIDSPETGIFPRAKNDVPLNCPLDVMNAKASSRTIRWAKPVQGQPESRNLHGIFFVSHVKNMHITEGTLFGRGNLVGR